MNVEYELELEDGSVLTFEWNYDKARSNLSKHGLEFEEAIAIFENDVLTIEDTAATGDLIEISFGEIKHGMDAALIVCVVHTDRNENIRIISARNATAAERKRYDDHF